MQYSVRKMDLTHSKQGTLLEPAPLMELEKKTEPGEKIGLEGQEKL